MLALQCACWVSDLEGSESSEGSEGSEGSDLKT